MPSYQIEFVGGGGLSRSPVISFALMTMALHRTSGLLAHHLAAEVPVMETSGWVTTTDNQAGFSVIFARS